MSRSRHIFIQRDKRHKARIVEKVMMKRAIIDQQQNYVKQLTQLWKWIRERCAAPTDIDAQFDVIAGGSNRSLLDSS